MTATLALTFSLLAATPVPPQTGPETLLPAIGSRRQAFGSQVYADAGRLLVSAPTQRIDSMLRRGVVYAYAPDSVTGLNEVSQILEPSIVQQNMQFGTSMDGDGDTLIISAPGFLGGSLGSVFVFEFDTASDLWVETQVITVPSPQSFGGLVMLEGDRLFVVEGVNSLEISARLHEYERSSATGLFSPVTQVDFPVDGIPGSNAAVDSLALVNADTLLVGQGRYDPPFPGPGSSGGIITLDRNPVTGTYSPGGVTFSPQPDFFAGFGSTMAWDGTSLLVGEPRFSPLSENEGRAHAYAFSPTAGLVLTQTFDPEDPAASPGNQFGAVLAAENGRALISERSTSAPFDSGVPTLRLFERDAGTGQYNEIGVAFTETMELPQAHAGALDGSRAVWGYPAPNASFDGPGGRTFVYDQGLDPVGVGFTYCDAGAPNSTGLAGRLEAMGSLSNFQNSFQLSASQLPPNSIALLLVSRSADLSLPAGSSGSLCLGGSIGRFIDLVQPTGLSGAATFALDLDDLPPVTGFSSTRPGRDFHFQAWYRDAAPTSTSNFTDALQVIFEL